MMLIYYFFFAEVGPTGLQWSGFQVVLAFVVAQLSGLAVIVSLFRKQRRLVEPQPLEVRHVGAMASEEDCAERFASTEKQIAELRRLREDDDRVSSKHRKSLYDTIERNRKEMNEHTESVRKELSEKLDAVPDRVIATLKNTGAI